MQGVQLNKITNIRCSNVGQCHNIILSEKEHIYIMIITTKMIPENRQILACSKIKHFY